MIKIKLVLLVGLLISIGFTASAQSGTVPQQDSTSLIHRYLPEVTVVGKQSRSDYHQMPEVVGTSIYAGKKNALIVLENVQGNIAMNTMRQVMAKVPGIHVWESDPSGIQIGIAARGLSPNRSWEFNVRQNGYDIAADPFGYPEAYYNPQLQAVQRIEVVRGQGSLQYGPQFGGLVNYILRNGSEINKPFEFETQQTAGSNNLFNSFNAIGGNKGKVHYYGFFDHRNGDGWRDNSRYFSNAGYGTVTYKFSPKFSLTGEVMHSHTRSQQAGGLTDELFKEDAQQSLRSRNWFDITWTTPALILNNQLSENSRINTKIFATIGNRNSVGYTKSITTPDVIDPATGAYDNRVLSADTYRNYGMESKLISDFSLGNMQNTFTAGMRLYTGTTHRTSDGKGTTGTEYDMTVIGNYARDINFKSNNAAVFAEAIFRLNDKFLVVPGIRYEWLEGAASGRNGYDNSGNAIMLQDVTRSRSFLLGGIGAEYHVTPSTEFYANYTQAYRPIQFANLQAPPTTDVIDPKLQDAKGYNIDFGYRGKWQNFLQFDVSTYYLQYNNRVGAVTPAGASYRLITNVGNSTSKGFEGYAEFNMLRAAKTLPAADLIIFGSYGYTDATYSTNHKDANTKGKKVENAPGHILRSGVSAGYKGYLLTAQVSYVGETFSDANNTVIPSANGQAGLIPSYTITDLTLSGKLYKTLVLKTGINNLFNERYFTRRAGGYPGPGVLPGDGRNFFITIGAKF